MPMNRVQFQPGPIPAGIYQTLWHEAQCEAALVQCRWPTGFSCLAAPLVAQRSLSAAQQAAHDLPVQRLPPVDFADRGHLVPRLQPAFGGVVPGHLPGQLSQDRFVCPGLKAISGRQLPHGLVDPPQADAGYGRARRP